MNRVRSFTAVDELYSVAFAKITIEINRFISTGTGFHKSNDYPKIISISHNVIGDRTSNYLVSALVLYEVKE